MSGFLYFLPNAKPSDIPANLNRWGLSHIVDSDANLHRRQCTGPGGLHGLIVGSDCNWTTEQVKASDQIEWAKFPKPHAECQAYLGTIKGEPLPTPAELERPDKISGGTVTLADGHNWLIPNAKVIDQEGESVCNLPLSFGLDEETGDWIANQVLPKYRAIWVHANAYLDAMMRAVVASREEGEDLRWVIPDHQQLIIDALQVNYRVSARELATLGVLTTNIAQPIANILIDSAGYQAIKKKAANGTGAG